MSDLEIGWNRAMCAKHLKLIANNSRFTIINSVNALTEKGENQTAI